MVREAYEATRTKRKGEIKAKHESGKYINGVKMEKGKTKAQIKSERPKLGPATHYTTPTNPKAKKKIPDWAGDVGRNYQRNQKSSPNSHWGNKGYREDYR